MFTTYKLESITNMWIVLAIVSSISLGFYDIVKKLALEGNNVFHVLFLNTFFALCLCRQC